MLPYTAHARNNPLDQVYNLGELYTVALREDAKLKAAEKSRNASRLDRPIARSDLLPQLSFQYSYNRFLDQSIDGISFGVAQGGVNYPDYSTDRWRINLRQTLFNMPQIIAYTQSRSASDAADIDYKNAQQDLILRLSEAYFVALSAQSFLEFSRAEKEALARQRIQAQQNFEVGRTGIADIRSAAAAYDVAVADEIAAQNRLSIRLNELEKITTMDVKHLMGLGGSMIPTPPVPNNINQWVEQALNNNTDILAKQIRKNIDEQEVKRLRSKHLPSLDLVAQRNESDTRGGATPRETDDLQVGVEFKLELFGGGRIYYETRQAAEKADQTAYELEQLRRNTKNSVHDSFSSVLTGIERIRALKEAVQSAQTALESNQAGFEAGTRTSSDVLLALKDLYRVQFDYKTAQHDYVLDTLRLRKDVGSLSLQDIIWVDRWLTEKTE